MSGILYLLPCPISDAPAETVLPDGVLGIARRLSYFLAENAKSTRAYLKSIGHPTPLRELDIVEIGHEPARDMIDGWLAPLIAGRDGALVSEAGCPAVADPGAALVLVAHREGIPVMPLIGPSSILLALMASGLGGQRFAFHGYLPTKEPERSQTIRTLEQTARRDRATQLFIETPYRSAALLDALAQTLAPTTLISVGADLSLPSQWIQTRSAKNWRGQTDAAKDRLAVFGIGV